MAKVLTILLVALALEAVGVVLLSRGLKEIGAGGPFRWGEVHTLLGRGAANPSLVAGILLETIFFGALLYPLSQRDVSLIWPLTSLGFVITAVAARWFLREEVSGLRWLGVILIVLGAALVSSSEVPKPQPARPGEPTATRTPP